MLQVFTKYEGVFTNILLNSQEVIITRMHTRKGQEGILLEMRHGIKNENRKETRTYRTHIGRRRKCGHIKLKKGK